MNHTVGIDLKKRNESQEKRKDFFYNAIKDAYIAGGGTKEKAHKYIYKEYGMHYSEQIKKDN